MPPGLTQNNAKQSNNPSEPVPPSPKPVRRRSSDNNAIVAPPKRFRSEPVIKPPAPPPEPPQRHLPEEDDDDDDIQEVKPSVKSEPPASVHHAPTTAVEDPGTMAMYEEGVVDDGGMYEESYQEEYGDEYGTGGDGSYVVQGQDGTPGRKGGVFNQP